jgi:hypothetical protein
MTIHNALTEAAARLSAAGIDTPSLDAALLLAQVLNTTRTRLILAYPDPLPSNAQRRFDQLLDRRLSGEPVAYILGRKEFRALDFTVTPDTLIPRPDTETLVEAALNTVSDTSPENNMVSDTPPEDNTLSDTPPENNTVSDAPPEDNLVSDTPPEDNAVSDTPPEDNTVSDTLPENTVSDASPEDNTVSDTSPEDNTVSDTSPEDNPVSDAPP